jgi:hypothetical protein
MDKEFILKVIYSPRSDSFIATLLREMEGLTLGVPKKPEGGPVVTGTVGKGYRHQIGAPDTVSDPGDQTRISAPPRPMPPNIRYQDIEEEPKPVTVAPQGSQKEWFTVTQAAEFTGLTKNSVRTYATSKGWEKRRAVDGKSIEISRASLLTYVKQPKA